jgi:pantothenate kinase
MEATFDQAVARLRKEARALAGTHRRAVIAISGGPGVGKSTLGAMLVDALTIEDALPAALIPMDGFHMAQAKLEALGIAADKGAPHTFEAAAFIDFLDHARTATGPVTGPLYSRKIEDVVPDGYVIAPDTRILVVEGNYLLLATPPWDRIAALCDLSAHISVPRDLVRRRLLARHAQEGLFTPHHIARHVDSIDLPNYDLVETTRPRAGLILDLVAPAHDHKAN